MADKDEHKLFVRFYTKAKENKRKSAESGRPIYVDIEMCEIRIPGEKGTELHVPAHDKSPIRDFENNRLTYAERFPEHYAHFQKGLELATTGTPLEELPFLTKAKVAELKGLEIHSAEALAAMEGPVLKRIGQGARGLKNAAEAYIEKAAGTADVVRLSNENADLKEQMGALRAEMAALAAAQKGGAPVARETSDSPFNDMGDEDIRNWITDNGGEQPHHRTGRDKLIALADELNETRKAREAA